MHANDWHQSIGRTLTAPDPRHKAHLRGQKSLTLSPERRLRGETRRRVRLPRAAPTESDEMAQLREATGNGVGETPVVARPWPVAFRCGHRERDAFARQGAQR